MDIYGIIKEHGGILLSRVAKMYGVTNATINKFVEDGILEKIKNGVYVKKGEPIDEYYLVQQSSTKVIFSCYTAAYLLGYTTRDPLVVCVSVPRTYNASNLKKRGIKVFQCAQARYSLGISKVKSMYGNELICYDIEKTICDMLGGYYDGDKSVVLETIKNYAKTKGKNIPKLMRYAEKLRVTTKLTAYMEILL